MNRVLFGSVLIASALSAPQAFAENYLTTSLGGYYPGSPAAAGQDFDQYVNPEFPQFNETRSAGGTVDYGVIRVNAQATASQSNPLVQAEGLVNDTFWLHSGSFVNDGQQVIIRAVVSIADAIDVGVNAQSIASAQSGHVIYFGMNRVGAEPYQFIVSNHRFLSASTGLESVGYLNDQEVPGFAGSTTHILEIPYILGTEAYLGMSSSALAYLQDDGAGSHSSVSSLLRWEGIQSVTLNSVAIGYSLTSVSGFDWSQAAPVPEADTWAMLVAGLGLVGWRASRRAPKVLSA